VKFSSKQIMCNAAAAADDDDDDDDNDVVVDFIYLFGKFSFIYSTTKTPENKQVQYGN